MLDREAINNIVIRLYEIDPQLSSAFLARWALRTLPFLVNEDEKEIFWYLDITDQPHAFYALFSALQISFNLSVFGDTIAISDLRLSSTAAGTYGIAGTAHDEGLLSIAITANNIAGIFQYAQDAANRKNKSLHFDPPMLGINVENEILNDFDRIVNLEIKSPGELINSPLWSGKIPDNWIILLSRFENHISRLNVGFDIWIDWLYDRMEGRSLSFEHEQKWLDIPYDIKGVKKINTYLASLQEEMNQKPLRRLIYEVNERRPGEFMSEDIKKKESLNVTQHFHAETNIGAQSYGGKNNVVTGKVLLKESDQQLVNSFRESVKALMEDIEYYHDADFKIKADAYNQLKQISEYLNDLENTSTEEKSKAIKILTSIKDGSSGAIKLGREIKESEETVVWLMEKAIILSTFLATLPT